jgi:hypothetical protein
MAYSFHPEAIDRFSNMFTTGSEEREIKRAGAIKKVKVPVEWNPLKSGFYTPPKLSPLGKYLLGSNDTWQ